MTDKFKILPIRDIKEQKRKHKINSRLFQPPFLSILLAPVKSGKSTFISNLLLNKAFGYGKYFDETYIFSPSILLDKTYWAVRKLADKFNINIISDIEDLENINEYLQAIIEEQKATDNENSVLIILDDCIDFMVKNKSALNALSSRFRHFNISILLTSQHLRKIPIVARGNAQYWCIWKLYNFQELKKLEDELGSNFPNFIEEYNKATKEKYNFLLVNMKNMTLRKNF